MFPVAFYRNLTRLLLVASLGLISSIAVAQDQSKDSAKDPKDEAQAQQDPKAQSAPSQNPADAVDPLKRPVSKETKKKNERALKQELSKPYKKWLDEDVVYIITDEEEAAFKALATDEERYHFIEQFWSRRDPTPDTVENEYRDEHYRRIANANERFRTAAGKSGWQTDRGRMYIVYGPPDQIESHPLGDDGGPPFEIWRYNHIQGVGDDLYISFIDRMRTGDYHTAPTNGRNPTTQ